ncbi:uncharacterized protein METZ01_LOCUS106704, partial [marine metagenome]
RGANSRSGARRSCGHTASPSEAVTKNACRRALFGFTSLGVGEELTCINSTLISSGITLSIGRSICPEGA